MIDEAHGGAGLDVFDAMLVLGECGRVLACVPLLGHLPATAILSDSSGARRGPCPSPWPAASGERPTCPQARRAMWTSAGAWTRAGVWPPGGAHGMALARGRSAKVTGELAFVPDAPGADLLVGVAMLDTQPVAVAIEAGAPGVSIEP